MTTDNYQLFFLKRTATLAFKFSHSNSYTLTWHYHIGFYFIFLLFCFCFLLLEAKISTTSTRTTQEHVDTTHHGPRQKPTHPDTVGNPRTLTHQTHFGVRGFPAGSLFLSIFLGFRSDPPNPRLKFISPECQSSLSPLLPAVQRVRHSLSSRSRGY
jgi:hypothetical protein